MLEPIREADFALNACGRPVPPKGLRWVDLAYSIPYQLVLPASSTRVVRVLNKAPQPFLCRAVYIRTPNVAHRVRWPDGLFLEKALALENPHTSSDLTAEMWALHPERFVEPAGAIQIELSSQLTANAADTTCTLVFFGILRHLLKACGSEPDQYVPSLSQAPRIRRYQNILAPEWFLGEQCTPETPAGYEDEPFTLFSNPVVVALAPDSTSVDNVVLLPGDADFVPRRIRFHTTLNVATGTPTFNLRLSDGYSITGGDLVQVGALPEWIPVFPAITLRAGTQLYVDGGALNSSGGPGTATTIVEFDGVKRRKLP